MQHSIQSTCGFFAMYLLHQILKIFTHHFTIQNHSIRWWAFLDHLRYLFCDVSKVGKLFAIAAEHVHFAIWIHNSDHPYSIQFDFQHLFAYQLLFMIGTVMCQLTSEHWHFILFKFVLGGHTVDSFFADSTS